MAVTGPLLGPYYTPGQTTSIGIQQSDPRALQNAMDIARLQQQGQMGVAGIGAQSAKDVAETQLRGQLAGYGTQERIAQGQLSGMLSGQQAQEWIAGQQAATQLSGYQTQKDIAAQQAATQQAGFGSQERIAGVQAEAAKYPATLAAQRFGQVFPYVQSQMAALGPGGGGGGGGGSTAPADREFITGGGVYSPADIQAQVNATRAATDAATEAAIRGQGEQMSGRGFSSRSPLAQALAGASRGQGMASNAAAEQSLRWTAAQGNAAQRLAAEQAQAAEYASRREEDIKRAQIVAQQQSALLSALAGMV